MALRRQYCSWCRTSAPQKYLKTTKACRPIHECSNCSNQTVQCLVSGCRHMACAGVIWDEKLCAEHRGSFRFELDDIDQLERVVGKSRSKAGRLLSLYGDFDSLEHFQIRKVREGAKHAVVFVNGFLSQYETDVSDWTIAATHHFRRATWYHLDWESTCHPKKAIGRSLGKILMSTVPTTMAPDLIWKGGNPMLDAATAWHLSMKNAEITGRLLANAIARTPGWRFTLAGHSLGARVVHFTLKQLAAQPRKRIENAYLLGAAVGAGAKDDDCWSQASAAVRGHIFNCYSRNDATLDLFYRGANVMISEPAGYQKIHLQHDKVHNFDCTALVDGHTGWKSQFGEIVRQLKYPD